MDMVKLYSTTRRITICFVSHHVNQHTSYPLMVLVSKRPFEVKPPRYIAPSRACAQPNVTQPKL